MYNIASAIQSQLSGHFRSPTVTVGRCKNIKYNVTYSSKKLLQQGIPEPEFFGDLVYRTRKIVGKSNFSEQFRKLVNRYKRIEYTPNNMRQAVCLVVNQITFDSYALLYYCTAAVRATDSMTASS